MGILFIGIEVVSIAIKFRMARLSIHFLLLTLLVLPCLIQILDIGQGRNSLFVRAQEDEAEGEEGDEGAVEDEEGGSEVENEEEAAADEETNKNVHKDADTQLL